MEYEEFFQDSGETVKLKAGKLEFMYKPATGGEELSWLNQYMKTDENGRNYKDLEVLNKLELMQIVEMPFSAELIKKQIGVEKSWDKLSKDERYALLSRMKSGMLNDIIESIVAYKTKGNNKKKD